MRWPPPDLLLLTGLAGGHSFLGKEHGPGLELFWDGPGTLCNPGPALCDCNDAAIRPKVTTDVLRDACCCATLCVFFRRGTEREPEPDRWMVDDGSMDTFPTPMSTDQQSDGG